MSNVEMKGIKRVDRSDLKNSFEKDYKNWIRDAEERKVDFSSYLNEKSPRTNPESRDVDNAVHSLLRQYGFQMKDTAYRRSSLVQEMDGNPILETLVQTDLINYYNSLIVTPELATRAKVSGIAPGDSFRPYAELPLRDQELAGQRVQLADLLAATDTVSGEDIRIPKFVPPAPEDMAMDYLTEFGEYPFFDISSGTEAHTMQTVGVALRWSYKFARNNAMRAALLRRAVRRVATEHAQFMIELALVVLMSTIPDDNAADSKEHAVQRYPTSGTAAYSVETQNAIAHALPQIYTVDSIVGGAGAITEWENVNTGSANLVLAALQTQAPGSVRRFVRRNINVMYPENTLVITKDITPNANGVATANNSTDLDVSAHQVFMFDSNETLGLAMEAGSTINETERKMENRSFVQYLANSFVFYINDPNGRLKIYLATS